MISTFINDQAAYTPMENMWFKLHDVWHIQKRNTCWNFKSNKLDFHMFFIPIGGLGHVSINGHNYGLRPGFIVVCRAGQEVRAEAAVQDEDGIYIVCFESGFAVLETANDPPDRSESLFPFSGDIDFTPSHADLALCDTMARCWHSKNKMERLRSQAAFHELLYSIMQSRLLKNVKGWNKELVAAKAFMERHYEQAIDIEQLAGSMQVSSRHFRRLFKDTYGISAMDYINELRMKKAKQLMEKGCMTIEEIARQTGYNNESHFRRMFRKQVGIPPALYLKNRQMKVAAYNWSNLGQLLPLHIIPQAAPMDQYWTDHYRRKYGADVTVPLGHRYDFNREALSRFGPDCIIGIDAYVTPEEQERLGQIARTFFVPWLTGSWRDHLRLIAEFLDRGREAEAWLDKYDDKAGLVSDKVNRLIRQDDLLTIMIDRKGCYRWVNRREDPAALPFAPRRIDQLPSDFIRMTADELQDWEAGRILILLSEDVMSRVTWHELQQTQHWKNLKAVRGQRVHIVTIGPWFEYTAYNHGMILDQIMGICGHVLP